MIEQPMPKEQLDDIAWVTGQSPLPVFADESVQRLKDIVGLKDVFTGINIKLMKCTGCLLYTSRRDGTYSLYVRSIFPAATARQYFRPVHGVALSLSLIHISNSSSDTIA